MHSVGKVDTAHGALRNQTTATRTEAAGTQNHSLDDEELPATGRRPAAWAWLARECVAANVIEYMPVVHILDVPVPQMVDAVPVTDRILQRTLEQFGGLRCRAAFRSAQALNSRPNLCPCFRSWTADGRTVGGNAADRASAVSWFPFPRADGQTAGEIAEESFSRLEAHW